MTYGQGASSALPVWGLFLNKVYKDKSLGYSQDDKFEVPEDFVPCDSAWQNTPAIYDSSIEEVMD